MFGLFFFHCIFIQWILFGFAGGLNSGFRIWGVWLYFQMSSEQFFVIIILNLFHGLLLQRYCRTTLCHSCFPVKCRCLMRVCFFQINLTVFVIHSRIWRNTKKWSRQLVPGKNLRANRYRRGIGREESPHRKSYW